MSWTAPTAEIRAVLIAQLSDLHLGPPGWLLGGRVDTAACLNAALDHLLALKPAPDVVVLSGDLTDGASAECPGPGFFGHDFGVNRCCPKKGGFDV